MASYYYHSTGKLQDGVKTGKLGAMTYIVGPDGKPVSRGFHEITALGGGLYRGKLGALTEEFWLSGQNAEELCPTCGRPRDGVS